MSLAGLAAIAAGCPAGPLPGEPRALEAELARRARAAWEALPTLRAEGSVEATGEGRLQLGFRLEAERGRWARLTLTSAAAAEPVADILVEAERGLAVRATPPGGRPRLYRGRLEELPPLLPDERTAATARLLLALARGEPPAARVLSVQPEGEALEVELQIEATRSRVRFRRSDGRPLSFQVRSDEAAGGCVEAEIAPERSFSLPETNLTLASDLRAKLLSCCRQEPAGTFRLRLTRIARGPLRPLPDWREPARGLDQLKKERWMQRAARREEALRRKLAQACAGARR